MRRRLEDTIDRRIVMDRDQQIRLILEGYHNDDYDAEMALEMIEDAMDDGVVMVVGLG